ncbi:MAG: PEP-CTERM sorting domain-containing protein [Leptolyngbyaceae cyanobacterium bins.59]|nr:PEP-CTERM sorting domain-containing protein [Leptolyngbyaceae cyanobacterium bins.59]
MQQAQAGTLRNGWNYSIDAANDGSGGAKYEIKGLAIKEQGNSVYVALTGGNPITGVAESSAADGNIGWGDLFFNFTGKSFKAASDSKSLFGIRFAATNDSPIVGTGVFRNVQATSVTSTNSGYSSLQQYYDYGYGRANTMGDIKTKQEAFNYFTNGTILNAIVQGEKVGEMTTLTTTALGALGLDFGQDVGTQTFGFSFDKSLFNVNGQSQFDTGSYIASVFLECGNDGIAIKDVPEPSALGGLALVGVGVMVRARRKRSVETIA